MKVSKIVNLTGQEVKILSGIGYQDFRTYPPEDHRPIPYVPEWTHHRTLGPNSDYEIDGIQCLLQVPAEKGIMNIPEPEEGTVFIVPNRVFEMCDRQDFVTLTYPVVYREIEGWAGLTLR